MSRNPIGTLQTAIDATTGANALAVSDAVKARLAEMKGAFPEDMTYLIPFDTTLVVKSSIREVQITIRSKDGLTIPQEYHETVFTPFFTLPEIAGSGHGLELAAVRAVLQAHGGDIILRNVSQDEGTQFVMRIPTNWDQYDGVDALS